MTTATRDSIVIDHIDGHELELFMRSAGQAFLHRYSDAQIERENSRFVMGRTIAARDGNQIVGGASIHTVDLTLAGRFDDVHHPTAKAAGLSWVHVSPTHRRQGIARKIMQKHLADCQAAGDTLGVLWASEGSIYRRFGYGPAVLSNIVEIDAAQSSFRIKDIPQRMRMVPVEQVIESVQPIYEEYCRRMPGAVRRDHTLWTAWITGDPETYDDLPSLRSNRRSFVAVCKNEHGVDTGYVRYRAVHHWNHGRPEFTINVNELVAIDDDAYRQLWRFVLDIDLATTVTAAIRPHEPLRWLLNDPRAAKMVGAEDGLWVRLVDVKDALTRRRYSSDGCVNIKVRDESLPDNDFTWRLAVTDGTADVEVTSAAPDIEMDVSDLGSAYLGAVGFRSMETAGLVVEHATGGVDRVDELFRPDVEPWCGVYF